MADDDVTVAVVAEGPPPVEEILRFGRSAHQRMVEYLSTRKQTSLSALAARRSDWDEVDRYRKLYVGTKKDRLKGVATASAWDLTKAEGIFIPTSYAAMEVRLVQEMSVILQRDPLIELAPGGPEDLEASRIMEQILAYDLRQNRPTLFLWSVLQSGEWYGLAPVYDSWYVEEGWKLTPPPGPESLPLPGPMKNMLYNALVAMNPSFAEPRREWTTLREYTRIQAIDPRAWYPDPDHNVTDTQDMTWCGHGSFVSWLDFAADQESGDPVYFNVGEAEKRFKKAGQRRKQVMSEYSQTSASGTPSQFPGSLPLDYFVCRIIPRHLGLGPEEAPQLWVFALLDDSIVVRAHRFEPSHQRMPYAVFSPNPEPHDFAGPGTSEMVIGLQKLVDWLTSAHLAYARRRIANSMVVVPELLMMEDLLGNNPGGVIRTSPTGSEMILNGETNLQSMYAQLEMPATTQSFLQDAQQMFQWLQLVTAASDPQMAQPLPTKRTLGEVQQIAASGASRIVRVVRLLEEQVLEPMAERMIANRREFTTMQQAVRIAGANGMDWREVDRTDLWGNYDYVPIVGMENPDPMRVANTWLRLLEMAGQIPPLVDPSQSPDGRVLDLRKVVEQFAREAGLRNFDQLLTYAAGSQPPPPQGGAQPGPGGPPQPPAVVSDAQLAEAVARGNVVPMEQAPPVPAEGG